MNVNPINRETRLGELILQFVDAAGEGNGIDRIAFLHANPEFRSELEAFIANHDRIEELAGPIRIASADSLSRAIASAISDATGPASRTETNDQAVISSSLGQLGDFRLLHEIGRGGMGVVYEAEQLSLKRRVALKVLPFAAAIDPRHVRRFKNEALAAASLNHANIVPVYAVGNERG